MLIVHYFANTSDDIEIYTQLWLSADGCGTVYWYIYILVSIYKYFHCFDCGMKDRIPRPPVQPNAMQLPVSFYKKINEKTLKIKINQGLFKGPILGGNFIIFRPDYLAHSELKIFEK